MDSRSLDGLGIPNEGVTVFTLPEVTIGERFRGLLFTGLPPGPAFLEQHVGRRLRETIDAIVREWEPDVLMIWSPNWASVLRNTATDLQRILYACDSFAMVNRNIARSTKNPIRKIYNPILARRYARYEKTYLPLYDEVVFVGARDAAYADLPPSVSVSIITNGVDIEELKPAAEKPFGGPPRIVFHGVLNYVPNRECVRFLGDRVGPMLEQEFGPDGFEIRIIGGSGDALEPFIRSKPWMTMTGYVDDLGAELAAGSVYAAPLTMGGGVKNKVLEAMACGLPVVGTSEAFEAMDVQSNVEVVICPVQRIPQETAALLREPARREALGKAARQWVVKNSHWDTVAARFESLFGRTPMFTPTHDKGRTER